MTQQLLTIASALIPGSLMVWFLTAIATRIFTRWQPSRPKLAQVERAIATAAPKPLKALPVLPSAPSEIAPLEPAKITPTVTAYESISLVQLRKLARRRGVVPIGDSRKRQAWIDALLAKQE